MVDPHQVLIDNGNSSSKISVTPNLPTPNLIQMNTSDQTQKPQQNQQLQQEADVNSVVSGGFDVNRFNENRHNVYDRQDEVSDKIMCGPSARNYTNSSIETNNFNARNSANVNTFLVAQNGDINSVSSGNSSNSSSSSLIPNNNNNFERDIEPLNKVCVIVNNNKQTRESNDSSSKQSIPSTSINSADIDSEFNSAEFQSNIALEQPQQQQQPIDAIDSISTINKMDSRKVEPLRININRDPIKTKIKLGTSSGQTMSPKSSTSSNAGCDELDDAHEMPHENQQIYPKIIIKPIVKPPTENEHHHHNHGVGSHIPSSSQEAIPKLKIKKIDVNNSNSNLTPPIHSSLSNSDDITANYQTHLLSESSPSVPKLATMRSSTNLSIGSNSYEEGNCTASNDVVPKLTIKFDNHSQHSAVQGDSTRSLVLNSGVKLTLKPIAEPPLPKFTITNAFNDTAKVVMLNSSEQTDESSDEQPSLPPSSQPSPNDKVSSRTEYATHAITSTSSTYPGSNVEDNLSTCSSGSSSSYSSSSSIVNPGNDIKLIIKATSTGGCVVSPNPSTVVRNSPSSVKSSNSLKVSSSKNISGDQSKVNNITSTVVTSSTANSNDAIPKLNIKLSNTDYPQVIHNEIDQNESRNDIGRTESPLPKLTIRMANPHDENIVIPKVTIKPVVNPNENTDPTAEAQLVTPKIILKPIPKPIEKPLEIITGGQGSPFRNSENESQQSPRIILKINKHTTSQTKESATLTSTTIIAEEPRCDSPQPAKLNELKRSNHETDVHAKKPKLGADVVQLLSSDSEVDDIEQRQSVNNNHNESHQTLLQANAADMVAAPQPSSFDTNSGLRSILSRPQMKIQAQPLQNFLQTLPPFKSTSDSSSKTNDVIDLCHDSNDQMIDAPLDGESTSKETPEVTQQTAESIDTNKMGSSKQRNTEQNKKSHYNWSFFYNENEREQNEPIHPLVQKDIERANVLAAMMAAANSQERSTNGSNNNNTAKQDGFGEVGNAKNLLIEHEGSSSDCIVIEDTASEPFPSEYTSGDNSAEQNGRKKDSVDRDSGVDVSNSVKSLNEDEITPITKRPRGRPRKGTTTPKTLTKKPVKTPGKKRKFAGVLMTEEPPAQPVQPNLEAMYAVGEVPVVPSAALLDIPIETQPALTPPTLTPSVSTDQVEDVVNSVQGTTVLNASETMTITSSTEPIAMETSASEINIVETPPTHVTILPLENDESKLNSSAEIDISSTEITETPMSAHSTVDKVACLISPTTPSVPKERKRRIIIDDDDESPTFNPLRSNKKIRGKNRRNRNMSKKQRKAAQLLSQSTDKTNENSVFTSPEGIEIRKVVVKDTTAAPLQVFEEDTRMSADSLLTSPTTRTTEFLQNDESQSSLHSSTSATVESSAKKIRSKIEVVDPEGRTEFTVDMIAEYDWPPPKGCCPSRNRDTYMIQEQIAEYLGVKSFKRKYPDLPRRMVEMEERNYLMEKALVSEKMCDLGLTAVLASDVLDIMNNDFFEKYEEYRRYLREKQIRDLTARQKQLQAGTHGKSLSARENAMRAASMWNTDFNRSRKENRRECLDLQNFVIQIPDANRYRKNCPDTKPSSYPVALVPGQFQEHYRKYNPAELLCYPINTVLADPYQLDHKLREYYNKTRRIHYVSDDESGSDSDSSSSSDSDSDDSDSSSDSSSSSDESTDEETRVKVKAEDDKTNILKQPKEENSNSVPIVAKSERSKCQICSGPERCNQQNKPEIFVGCSNCRGNSHPTCLKMSARMARRVNEYAWRCKKCKICIKCRLGDNDDKMLFCDQCDRSYHIYCIGLRKVPNGKWHCAVCTVCTLCGARRPEGHNNPNLTQQQKQKLLAVAKWTHEYQVNPVTKEEEHVSMLCTSCMAIKHSAAKNAYFN